MTQDNHSPDHYRRVEINRSIAHLLFVYFGRVKSSGTNEVIIVRVCHQVGEIVQGRVHAFCYALQSIFYFLPVSPTTGEGAHA